uniref:Uncharacterized protein n=1 Tax=Rhizophora mucronata TaxID=61149 RepID=A0A2P2NDY1_RHIMU
MIKFGCSYLLFCAIATVSGSKVSPNLHDGITNVWV